MKAAIICFFMAISLSGRSQGFIDYEAVSRDYPVKCELQQEFDTYMQDATDSVYCAYEPYVLYLDYFSHHDLMMDSLLLASYNRQSELLAEQAEAFRLQACERVLEKQRAMNTAVKQGIKEELSRFCRLNGVVFLVERGALIYSDADKDYTGAFIAFLNAKK